MRRDRTGPARHPPSCAPFAPGPLRPFHAPTGPSDSCPPHSGTLRCNACSTSGQVSRIHALRLPAIPSPNTCGCSALSGHATPRQVEPRLHPSMGSSPNEISGLYHSLAGSPHHTGRIEFVILRTGRSPLLLSTPSRDDAVAVGYKLR